MAVSVVVSTYERPEALELVLLGLARQSWRGFEVVVADDGSGPETARVVADAAARWRLDLVHVWHPDRGFRKTEILNRAIVAAGGDYLVFTDGDCIPREDFVERHVRLRAPGRYLSGGYVKLSREVTERVGPEEVESGRLFDPGWLRRNGWRGGRRRLRLVRSPALGALLDVLTPTRATWNGHNASTWREALLRVNGFDLGVGYGSEDRLLGVRLRNAGVRGKQVRFRTPCLHLHHDRPYLDPGIAARNRERADRVRREGQTRAPRGIEELEPEEGVWVRRWRGGVLEGKVM